MSRDRLAERRRAREDAQRSAADPLQQYDYPQYDSGYAPPLQQHSAGYGAYGEPAYYGDTMSYSNDAAQASTASLHGAPPPSYRSRSRHTDDYDGDQGAGASSREPGQRRPSRSRQNSSDGRPSYQRGDSKSEEPPPMPSNSRRNNGRQPSYGDQNAYYENNQSSTALNAPSQRQQSYGNFDRQPAPARRSRKGTSDRQENDMYEIPTLPKGSRQRQQSRQQTMEPPQSPPYSAVAPGSAGPSPGNGGSAMHVTSDAPDIDMNAFFEELDSVRESMREMEQYVTYIDQLHSRNMSGTAGDEVAAELENANDSMRKLTNSLRKRVKALQETTRIRTHGQAELDRLVRKTQTEGLKSKFMEMLQNYRNMEMKQRDRFRQKIERQYLIAKPNASPEEVRQAVEDGQDGQVFAQALRQSNRVGNAQSVLNEVQSRHEAIKKMERTLLELFQMFQDISQLVDEQDEQLIMVEEKAEEAAKDVEAGHTEIVQAVGSAKKARKKRKCCCIISLILFLILAGVLAYLIVKVILPKINENKANNEKEEAKEQPTRTVTQSAGTRTQQAAVNTNANGGANGNSNGNTAGAGSMATTTRALRVRDLLALAVASTGAGDPEIAARRYAVRE